VIKKLILAVIISTSLGACKNSSSLQEPNTTRSIFLDTFLVPSNPVPYWPTTERTWDLIHTNLQVSIDWQNSSLSGEAELFLHPYAYAQDSLLIDAKGFNIKSLSLVSDTQNLLQSKTYDGKKIRLYLTKKLSKLDTLVLNMSYSVFPDSLPDESSGKAIASEKGLFFINPRGTKTSKARQLWTQGETEFNSKWFPTIDNPNERMTHEFSITVEEELKSLSNGELVFSTLNGDGTRTDVWEMKTAHAPYLAMMAVGEFVEVLDTSAQIPVSYWVEKSYQKEAPLIFGNTPEMISFFSKITGLNYPWNKYDQLIARDYVSGAMENTTAVIHGEFLYHRELELMDTDEDDIIAHELFHHWFGDYVTCESWSNLTLNEGFATYGEYLWREHSKGKHWAQFVLMNFKQNYFEEARFAKRPLIRFNYRTQDELFDRHSYDKGGLVLHMLRNMLGDEVFFNALRIYLNDNALSSVEIHDLRLAFEKASGKDLNWFFNQWYLGKGHPELEIAYAVKESSAEVLVIQKQVHDGGALFTMPAKVLVKNGGRDYYYDVLINEEVGIFSIPITDSTRYISFDPQEVLLADKQETKSSKWLVEEILNSENIEKTWRIWVQLLERSELESLPIDSLYKELLKHKSQHLRKLSTEWLDRDIIGRHKLVDIIRNVAQNDSSSIVRNEALLQLLNLAYPEKLQDFVRLCDDPSILVSSTAISALSKFSLKTAIKCAAKIENSPYDDHKLALGEVYSIEADPKRVFFFKSSYENMGAFNSPELIRSLGEYLKRVDDASAKIEGLSLIQDYLVNQTVWWQKIVGVDALNALKRQQENTIRKMSALASKGNLSEEENMLYMKKITAADMVLENISAVREVVLATETNARIKELLR